MNKSIAYSCSGIALEACGWAKNRFSVMARGVTVASGLVRAVVLMTVMTCLASTAGAEDISLEGSFSYSYTGTKLTLKVGKVVSYRSGGTSGTLRMQLWASSSPYSGGTLRGYVMGTHDLGQLRGGYYFPAHSSTVTFTSPPAGTYYTTLTLEEYDSSGFVIVDYVSFSGTQTFSSGGGGAGAAILKLEGSAGWSKSGTKLTIKAEKVSNTGGSTSGALRLQVWATQSEYAGGGISGYVLGYVTLSKLKAGYYYSNINKTGTYKKPPSGTYYTTITLEEQQSGGRYTIKSYARMSGPTQLGTTTTTPTTPSGGDGQDYFTTHGYAKLAELGKGEAPSFLDRYQLWSLCRGAMIYYDVWKSNKTSANWTAHETTAKVAIQFYLKAPYD